MINYAMRRCLMPRSAAAPPPDLLTGLRWFYDLDEASGNALADYGTGGNWINIGSVGQGTGPGGVGNCRTFNGTSQYFASSGAGTINQFKWPVSGAATLSLWFKPTSFTGNRDILGVSIGGAWTSATNLSWGVRCIATTGVVRFAFNDESTIVNLDTVAGVSINDYHHLLIWDDGNTVNMSVDNGSPVSYTHGDITWTSGHNTLYTGAVEKYFAGSITRAAFWDRSIAYDSAEGIALATYPYTYAELT